MREAGAEGNQRRPRAQLEAVGEAGPPPSMLSGPQCVVTRLRGQKPPLW